MSVIVSSLAKFFPKILPYIDLSPNIDGSAMSGCSIRFQNGDYVYFLGRIPTGFPVSKVINLKVTGDRETAGADAAVAFSVGRMPLGSGFSWNNVVNAVTSNFSATSHNGDFSEGIFPIAANSFTVGDSYAGYLVAPAGITLSGIRSVMLEADI